MMIETQIRAQKTKNTIKETLSPFTLISKSMAPNPVLTQPIQDSFGNPIRPNIQSQCKRMIHPANDGSQTCKRLASFRPDRFDIPSKDI